MFSAETSAFIVKLVVERYKILQMLNIWDLFYLFPIKQNHFQEGLWTFYFIVMQKYSKNELTLYYVHCLRPKRACKMLKILLLTTNLMQIFYIGANYGLQIWTYQNKSTFCSDYFAIDLFPK